MNVPFKPLGPTISGLNHQLSITVADTAYHNVISVSIPIYLTSKLGIFDVRLYNKNMISRVRRGNTNGFPEVLR